MATVLQNIGMSKAGTSLSEYVNNQRTLAMNEALTTARKNSLEQSTELTRNQLVQLKQQQKENNKILPFNVLLDRAKIPAVRDYIDKVAKANAFVNPDGTIRAGNARKLNELLRLDMHKSNISWMRLDHAQSEYDKFQKASKNPEFAKELKLKPEEVQQGLALATRNLLKAQSQNSEYQEGLKTKVALETARAQKAAAEARRLASLKSGDSDYTLSDKKLEVWKKYIADPESLNDQEKDMIGVLVDPYIRIAASTVLSDLASVAIPYDQKAKMIMDMAKQFRASGKTPEQIMEENPPLTEDEIKNLSDEELLKRLQ